MKESIAISVENVSKKFRLFGSPQQRLLEALHPFNKKYHREFWALKDVSFEVPKGTTLGIIGRNGSGKTTLLQVICGILRPSGGAVTINGRISSILDLGAGFNPEFTGRDNVLLNGALMGFSSREMKQRLPLIEEFAEIGQFIDQPVKTYSSGMFLRLAFAAAINVDADILVVDEALAVGDAKFQNKCYRKFLEFQEAGKTILFVTHDMHAIARHCDSALLLENGTVLESGDPNDVVNRYFKIILMGDLSEDTKTVAEPSVSLEATTPSSEKCVTTELDRFLEEVPTTDNCIHRNSYNKNEYRFGDRRAEIVDYLMVCGENYDPTMARTGDTIDIYIKVLFHELVQFPVFGFQIKTIDGILVFGSNTWLDKIYVPPVNKGEVIVFNTSIKLTLLRGDYFISRGVGEKVDEGVLPIDYRNDFIHLTIQQKKMDFQGIVEMETQCKVVSGGRVVLQRQI